MDEYLILIDPNGCGIFVISVPGRFFQHEQYLRVLTSDYLFAGVRLVLKKHFGLDVSAVGFVSVLPGRCELEFYGRPRFRRRESEIRDAVSRKAFAEIGSLTVKDDEIFLSASGQEVMIR